MKLLPAPAGVRYAGVVLLFGICGACSEFFLTTPNVAFPAGTGMLPVPFALLCALLFMRKWRAIIAIPLVVAVWFAASAAAFGVGIEIGNDFLVPGCVGGLIGGCGLVLCVATCHWQLLSRKNFFGGAVIGSVSALGFGPWVGLHKAEISGGYRFTSWFAILIHLHLTDTSDEGQKLVLLIAFAIWQAAVGTYLYKIVRDTGNEAQPEESAGLTIVQLPSAAKDGTR